MARIFPAKNQPKSELTGILFPTSVFIPREAGLLHFGVRSTYILGLQIGSILSRLTAVANSKGGS
jgi:hypothetical protein